MKGHKQVKKRISPWELEGKLDAAVNYLQSAGEGLVDPQIVVGSGYYNDTEIEIMGWVPMTEKEKAAAERRRQQAQHAARVKAEKAREHERKELERLAKKHGLRLEEEK